MFFMMGITDGRKELNYSQTEICSVCGCYGRYQVFMTYTVLSLFFIPCFKCSAKIRTFSPRSIRLPTSLSSSYNVLQQLVCT